MLDNAKLSNKQFNVQYTHTLHLLNKHKPMNKTKFISITHSLPKISTENWRVSTTAQNDKNSLYNTGPEMLQ
jgi:hypothetical protein